LTDSTRADTVSGYLAGFRPHVLTHLTPELGETAGWLVGDEGIREIATRHYISESALESRWRTIKQTLGVSRRTGLVRLYYGIDRCGCA
jgi:DNA-binding NarL/FixJ family response regulator